MKKLLYLFLAAAIAFAMVGCPNDSNETPPGPAVITVTVTGPSTVAPGATRAYTATVTGTTNTAVTWSLTGATDAGTTLTNGSLTVAANEAEASNKLTVKATSVADPTKSGTRVVTVGTPPPLTIKFFDYSGGSSTPLKTMTLEDGQQIQAADYTLPRPPNRGWKYMFRDWATADGDTVTDTSFFAADTNVYGRWWSGEFTGGNTTGAEKVYLENQSWVIYQFDLSSVYAAADDATTKKTKLLAAIKGLKAIEADYGVSEATIAAGGGPRNRVVGPYFFNGTTKITLDEDYGLTKGTSSTAGTRLGGNEYGSEFWGDFKADANSKPTVRLDGTSSMPGTFNKWHPYMIQSEGGDGWNDFNGGTPTANTWISKTHTFGTAAAKSPAAQGDPWSYPNTMALLETILDTGEAMINVGGTPTSLPVLPPDTDYSKIYFGIGLTRANADSVVDRTSSIWNHGRVFLIKNVKLVLADGTTKIAGTVPSLTIPAGTYFENNGTEKQIPATPSNRQNQVFASYINPVVGGWRGAVDAEITITNSPGWVAPNPPPDAVSHIRIPLSADDATIFGSKASDTTAISKASDGTISVNLGAGDDNSWGSLGISFNLPDDVKTATYDQIHIIYDAVIDSVSDDRAQLSSKAGRSAFSPNLPTISGEGNASSYPFIIDGTDQMFRVPGSSIDILAGLANGAVGISFQVNNYAASNVPQKFTIKFKEIVIRAP